MNKTIKYKIIGHEFGMPPRGCTMVWDEPYDCWTVTDAYNTGSPCKSMWSGNPELCPDLFKPIDNIQPIKHLKTLDDIQGNNCFTELLPF